MPYPALRPATFGNDRVVLYRRLSQLMGPHSRLLWIPRANDSTIAVSADNDGGNIRIITWDATVTARLSTLGNQNRLVGQSFASVSTQYGTTPSTANLSFGNGTIDSAFSVFALANVTDTAAARAFVTKWGTSNREWFFRVNVDDTLQLELADESAGVTPVMTSNAAITQGSIAMFGASYSGLGGATAANGITLYQNGIALASTATNNASYVAMEPLAAPVEIGSLLTHTANLMDGTMACIGVCARALDAAEMQAINGVFRQYGGVSL